MKTRIIFSLVLSSTLLISCTSTLEKDMAPRAMSKDVFFASFDNNDQTKVMLGDNGKMLWKPYDNIAVYVNGKSLGGFIASCTGPSETTGFYQYDYDKNISIEVPESGQFIAVYPSLSEEAFDLYGTSFSINYPATCSAGISFPSGSFYSVAISNDRNLNFKHTSGALKFTVSQEDVTKIIIKANNANEALAGTARFKINDYGVPELVTMTNCSNELTITLGGAFFETNKEYFISLPPGTYSDGFSFEFHTPYSVGKRTISKEVIINRAEIALLTNANKGTSFEMLDGNDEFYHDVYETFGLVGGMSNGYLYTPYTFANNLCGDDLFAAGANFLDLAFGQEVNEFRYNSDNQIFNNLYQTYLDVFKKTNVFLKFQYGKSETLDRQLSEVRVLRAFCQMMLTLGWHNPPLYSSNDSNLPNSPYENNLAWCAKECIESAEYLQERRSTADKDGVWTVTKGFAYAIAGKAYLYNGDYSNAKSTLKKVIDSGRYALVPGERYWENFHVEGDGNEEKLFEYNLEYNSGISAWSGPIQHSSWMQVQYWNWRTDHFAAAPNYVYSGVDGWGGLGVPQWFGDAFFENDGHSARFDASLKHIDDVVYNMVYSDNSINDMTLSQKKSSTKIGIKDTEVGLYSQSFWLPFKVIIRSSDTNPTYGNNINLTNFTFMRYAEVLLLYAESCLQVGDQGSALSAINQIRQRAGITPLSEVNMDVLKKEKAFELWLEGSRWFDLVRWGDTERVVNAGHNIPKLFDKLFRAPRSGENVTWENGSEENSRFYTVSSHQAIDVGYEVGFKSGKHEYFPYPEDILKNNPSIQQNPGW